MREIDILRGIGKARQARSTPTRAMSNYYNKGTPYVNGKGLLLSQGSPFVMADDPNEGTDMERTLPPNLMKKGGLVRGKRGVDKVPAMLTHGEAVLPVDTVKAVGSHNIARLIADTNNAPPKRGLRMGMHAATGFVEDVGNIYKGAKDLAGSAAQKVGGMFKAAPAAAASVDPYANLDNTRSANPVFRDLNANVGPQQDMRAGVKLPTASTPEPSLRTATNEAFSGKAGRPGVPGLNAARAAEAKIKRPGINTLGNALSAGDDLGMVMSHPNADWIEKTGGTLEALGNTAGGYLLDKFVGGRGAGTNLVGTGLNIASGFRPVTALSKMVTGESGLENMRASHPGAGVGTEVGPIGAAANTMRAAVSSAMPTPAGATTQPAAATIRTAPTTATAPLTSDEEMAANRVKYDAANRNMLNGVPVPAGTPGQGGEPYTFDNETGRRVINDASLARAHGTGMSNPFVAEEARKQAEGITWNPNTGQPEGGKYAAAGGYNAYANGGRFNRGGLNGANRGGTFFGQEVGGPAAFERVTPEQAAAQRRGNPYNNIDPGTASLAELEAASVRGDSATRRGIRGALAHAREMEKVNIGKRLQQRQFASAQRELAKTNNIDVINNYFMHQGTDAQGNPVMSVGPEAQQARRQIDRVLGEVAKAHNIPNLHIGDIPTSLLMTLAAKQKQFGINDKNDSGIKGFLNDWLRNGGNTKMEDRSLIDADPMVANKDGSFTDATGRTVSSNTLTNQGWLNSTLGIGKGPDADAARSLAALREQEASQLSGIMDNSTKSIRALSQRKQ